MNTAHATVAPGSAPLTQKQQFRLDTANLVLKKLAELELRNFKHGPFASRLAVTAAGTFHYHLADPGSASINMDCAVQGPHRLWPGFPYTRSEMVFLRALAAFVRDGVRITGRVLAAVFCNSFVVDSITPVIDRYRDAITAFRFAGVFSDTDKLAA